MKAFWTQWRRCWVSRDAGLFGVGLFMGVACGTVACSTTEGSVPQNPPATGGSVATGGVGTGGALTAGSGSGGAATGGDAAGGASTGGSGGAGVGGAAGVGGSGVTEDTVTRTSATFTFQHFPIETDEAGVWNGPLSPGQQAVSTTYDTVVLENGYLKVTLLPDYGGRILSVVHKPTGRELLYQNPIGTPYLMQEDIFYYNYLVIMGGIFPSFPEPEHGRYWNQPYALEIVSESPEAVTVRMSRQDDLDVAPGVPTAYDVGRTDILVELDVTLRAGRASLELGTKLSNTRNSAVDAFEYWTVTTLAPGSSPGQTEIPLSTRILAQMDQVHLLESSWSWFGTAEQRVVDEVFTWNNLSYFENWVDQGTGFANPRYEANFSGLVNYENDMGILRVSDNVETPGLKLWTFGRDSLTVDINDSNEWLRPTIEMWHGVTPEFWQRGSMSAGEVRQWTDHYLPTLGLQEVTSAGENGALFLSTTESGSETVLNVAAALTLPGQTVHAILRLDDRAVLEQDVLVADTDATSISVAVAGTEISPGTIFEVEFTQGTESLLLGQLTLP